MYKVKNNFILISGLFLSSLLVGCTNINAKPKIANNNISAQNISLSKIDGELGNLQYHSGQAAYSYINHNHANLKTSDWKYNHVSYNNLDMLNRTSKGNVAYLQSDNVANDSLRTRQSVKPTAWHQKFIDHDPIINRGHEIAYSLSKGISMDGKYKPQFQSGDLNNPKNLFTQTAFSNQKVQTIFESKVRNALKDGKKVIYSVKPIFRGSELMARGVHMQALSTDKALNFNVYLYNVQPKITFNYASGRSSIDQNMNVPTPADAPTFNDNHQSNVYHGIYHSSYNHMYKLHNHNKI
ncbi:DNA-entry nuclease [Apilactobacillus micheneri]|uniref:DNA/RNA non-specific endonuclease n=1 Tax=Apilactobacillus micheneri TaxID=1899430 RepID=UPI00112BD8C5|nr:DNA/RNA non-specific endonuclease [Apilactobacillus micheneri]TPR49274.1 DNA-entry nuclease [Apilactobacillus micheneri]